MNIKSLIFDCAIGFSMVILLVFRICNFPTFVIDIIPQICSFFNGFLWIIILSITILIHKRPTTSETVKARLRDQRVFLLLVTLFFSILYFK